MRAESCDTGKALKDVLQRRVCLQPDENAYPVQLSGIDVFVNPGRVEEKKQNITSSKARKQASRAVHKQKRREFFLQKCAEETFQENTNIQKLKRRHKSSKTALLRGIFKKN